MYERVADEMNKPLDTALLFAMMHMLVRQNMLTSRLVRSLLKQEPPQLPGDEWKTDS